MKIEVRSDSVNISGYVNAVGRDSKPLVTGDGRCVEMVEPGTFRKALERAEDVELRLNHQIGSSYASVKGGTLKLAEDNIGLRAECTLTDPKMIDKARNKEFRGWSFGMYVNESRLESRANDIPRRHLTDIDIFEVSLIDSRKSPCYAGTSVECRADGDFIEFRAMDFTNDDYETASADYSGYEKRLKALD